ncbi:hypothetical protein [Thermotalea metallivorans]|uniref:Uncharacterized protein n=1 Tax=Thermotalea metallivorans TaxID=520762 RepID=A0A140L8J4_9FIRM|nr:hypothetical protein [Thermotalea metallivorans]KXG76869.1 hypothetical protein AN619_08610 [Thermotalea metallivorans]
MLAAEYSVLHKIIASLLVGFSIKLMDDYIDEEKEMQSSHSLVKQMGKGTLPYAMILTALAAGFHGEYAVTLTSACYIVGMFHHLNTKLLSGLRSYQESLLVMLINVYFFSFQAIFSSIIIILLIQIADDILDVEWDRKYGFKNYANQFGKGEAIIVTLILGVISIMFYLSKFLIVVSSAIWIEWAYKKIHR